MDRYETICEFIEHNARENPDHTAVIYGQTTLTYKELNEKANQLAHYLVKLGASPNTPVALCMERSDKLLIAMVAILKSGGGYLPLDPEHPEARLMYTLQDNDHPIIITTANTEEKFTNYPGKKIILDNDQTLISECSSQNPPISAAPNHLAYIIYTSGSTGKPKGVMIEHQSVINYALWFAEACACQPEHRIDFSSNYIFDMPVTTSIVSLMLGLTVTIADDETKKVIWHYLQYLEENNINIIKITPSYFKALLDEVKNNPIALPDLVSIMLGGENLSSADCKAWLNLYPEQVLFNEYGPTEATVGTTIYKISLANIAHLNASVPIGQPGTNMECYLLDADNNPVTEGEIGELYIGGLCLARGYLNQPELNQKRFIPNPFSQDKTARLYKTGDLCRWLPDGNIEYLDRIDNQLKIRGFRVEPTEIERCLASHPAIKDAVILAQKEGHDDKLIAYYILYPQVKAPSIGEIHQHLEAHLPDYMIPTSYVRIDALPLTANGKLDKHALPVPRFTTNQYYLAPSTTLEKTLAEIWSEELGIKLVGIEDNFFELGGHSLSAARVISKIHTALGKDLTLHAFYEAATIKKLIKVLEKTKSIEALPAKRKRKIKNNSTVIPLSDFQLLLWLSDTFEPKAKKMNIFARKRFQGNLDKDALNFAFKAILKKHEIFSGYVSKIRPIQYLLKNLHFQIIEQDLTHLSSKESEEALHASLSELIRHHPWDSKAPMLIAKLFHLKHEEDELQICMPHIISDDLSPNILFTDLSKAYLLYPKKAKLAAIEADTRYKEYQYNEARYSKERVNRDLVFWKDYLSDASLFSFPEEMVVKNMGDQNYSSYISIAEQELTNLQQLCALNHISINDGLIAVLCMALIPYCNVGKQNKHIFINIVKSTRDNQLYDDTIGCFLKLAPIKISLGANNHLIPLAKQVHQAIIDTTPYQRASGIIKLASVGAFQQKKSIKSYILQGLIYIYTQLFPSPNLSRKLLNLCTKLTEFQRKNEFVINLNVQKDFIGNEKHQNKPELFGLKHKKVKKYQYDLMEIESVLDVCLLREQSDNKPYIVISANLKAEIREKIGKEIIHIIHSATQKTKRGALLNLQE
jgi:amino acid adenylation domain-containing protein